MNYKDTPEYEGQHRELKPEGKKLLAKVAIFLAIIGTAFGASQTEAAKKIFNVANEVKSGEVSPDLITIENGGKSDIQFDLDNSVQDSENPDMLRYDNGAKTQEIVSYELNNNEVIHIKEGASLRGAPFVGSFKNDITTTVATTNQDIILSGELKYSIISNPENAYEDQFMSIDISSLPQELQDELRISPDIKVLCIKLDDAHSEVLIEKIVEASNTETVSSVSE